MNYCFDIIGTTSLLTFFNYQQQLEQNQNRGKAYLGSHECSLDGFIESVENIPKKPDWNWDDVVGSIVNFWLKNEDKVRYWQNHCHTIDSDTVIVARVGKIEALRKEFESLFDV
ncbi:conserved hypothetical protein [Crocosphaera subtropica ATCC 51142]|uniref:Uncharacterized protein n=1 Tax=Crocosphaera subtropica (strain ATCC 51142 / BH68) TaxID=43989 RepID=B1WR89_CROS5|nr:hypothetical protein [Crocosphaera subtropica]ACB50147.1 conserved hypothetical protein [Crocosphaera subtropica ATCC 51142]